MSEREDVGGVSARMMSEMVAAWQAEIAAFEAAALRVAAGTPTPLFGICPDCNVAGGHYPTCTALRVAAGTPTHHRTEEDT